MCYCKYIIFVISLIGLTMFLATAKKNGVNIGLILHRFALNDELV